MTQASLLRFPKVFALMSVVLEGYHFLSILSKGTLDHCPPQKPGTQPAQIMDLGETEQKVLQFIIRS
jgi:hypothetical protein